MWERDTQMTSRAGTFLFVAGLLLAVPEALSVRPVPPHDSDSNATWVKAFGKRSLQSHGIPYDHWVDARATWFVPSTGQF